MASHGTSLSRRGLFLLLLFSLVMGLPLPALGSVNIPLHHWSYEALDRLSALGLLDQAMMTARPYSRKQAARYVARVLERIRSDEIRKDGRETIAEPLLDRLMSEYKPELLALGSWPSRQEPGSRSIRVGGRLTLEADSFSVGHGEVRFRENRGGEYYANGLQVQTDMRGWVEVTDALAFSAQPKYVSNAHALGFGATENNHNLYMREINAKVTVANITFQAGRSSLWWGPGYHGSLLVTDHAFPMDMLQLGTEEAFKLPGWFQRLGQWKINTFLSQLERDRDFSRAKVFGVRLSYLPTTWLELGVTRLTQFGGRGRDQSFPQAIVDAYTRPANAGGADEVNEQGMIDFKATVPRVPYLVPFPAGMQGYGELGTEDKWSKIPLPSRAAVLGGIYIPQLFEGDSMDLRIEYADTDFTRRKTSDQIARTWYNNGTYSSGMRYRGLPLGHHMGTDGIDFFVRTTRSLTETLRMGTNLNIQERDRGQPVHETKREAAVDLTWWLSSRTELTIGYAYQRLKSPGQITSITPYGESFASGVAVSNHLLWTSLAVEF
jgi:hypothetical protein